MFSLYNELSYFWKTTFEFILFWISSFRRYFGIEIGHYQVAIYTARRDEMIEVVQATLFYFNADAPVPVHSLSSDIPYEVSPLICLWFKCPQIL